MPKDSESFAKNLTSSGFIRYQLAASSSEESFTGRLPFTFTIGHFVNEP